MRECVLRLEKCFDLETCQGTVWNASTQRSRWRPLVTCWDRPPGMCYVILVSFDIVLFLVSTLSVSEFGLKPGETCEWSNLEKKKKIHGRFTARHTALYVYWLASPAVMMHECWPWVLIYYILLNVSSHCVNYIKYIWQHVTRCGRILLTVIVFSNYYYFVFSRVYYEKMKFS